MRGLNAGLVAVIFRGSVPESFIEYTLLRGSGVLPPLPPVWGQELSPVAERGLELNQLRHTTKYY